MWDQVKNVWSVEDVSKLHREVITPPPTPPEDRWDQVRRRVESSIKDVRKCTETLPAPPPHNTWRYVKSCEKDVCGCRHNCAWNLLKCRKTANSLSPLWAAVAWTSHGTSIVGWKLLSLIQFGCVCVYTRIWWKTEGSVTNIRQHVMNRQWTYSEPVPHLGASSFWFYSKPE